MHTPTKLFLCVIAICFTCVYGDATNRTIDDTYGDATTGAKPTYEPANPGVWQGNDCTECVVQPDRSLAHNGTWMAATYIPDRMRLISVTLSFKGTAIYVYFILPNYISDKTDTATACNFTLDGRPVGFFSRVSNINNKMVYNALVFSQEGLVNIDHTLVISTSGHNYFVNFDYAIYTFDDGLPTSTPDFQASIPSSSTSGSSTGAESATTVTVSTYFPQSNSSTQHTTPTTSIPSSDEPALLTSLKFSSEEPQPSSSSLSQDSKHGNVPVGVIAAGTVGGVVLFLAILVVLCLLRRSRQKRAMCIAEDAGRAVPFTMFRDLGLDRLTSRDISDQPEITANSGEEKLSLHSIQQQDGVPVPTQTQQRAVLSIGPGSVTEDLRRARQVEISRQLTELVGEMQELNRDQTLNPSVGVADGIKQARSSEVSREEREMVEIRDQMQAMRERVAYLEAQQHSEWAQGLTDDPPPGYQ